MTTYRELVDLQEHEFEILRGKSFAGGNFVGVHSKIPTYTTEAGNEFHSVICFDTYAEYLYYQYKAKESCND